jgi:hypothetical protein
MVRFQADLVYAEVQTKSGRRADADRILNALDDQSKREGYVAFELEAGLLFGAHCACRGALFGVDILPDGGHAEVKCLPKKPKTVWNS